MPVLMLINSVGWVASYVVGLAYPAVLSIQAIESRTTIDDTQWLMYWFVYALLTLVEAILYPYIKWFPLYHVGKTVGLAWLVLPQFKGALYVYEQGVLPVYRQIIKVLNDLTDKHPELKKYIGTHKRGIADKLNAKLNDLKDTQ